MSLEYEELTTCDILNGHVVREELALSFTSVGHPSRRCILTLLFLVIDSQESVVTWEDSRHLGAIHYTFLVFE
jgi:hypothetical protein